MSTPDPVPPMTPDGIIAMRDLYDYGRIRKKLPSIVRRAHNGGASQSEIARASGLSRQWVAELLARTAPPTDTEETQR